MKILFKKYSKLSIIFLFFNFLFSSFIVISFACNNTVDCGCNDVVISNIAFVKIGGVLSLLSPEEVYGIKQENVSEYVFGDTMAVKCRVNNPIWTLDGNRDRPIEPLIVAKITSSKTGDVQYVTLVQDRDNSVELDYKPGKDISGCLYIGYISPVKHDKWMLVPDTTKQQLSISPNGDTLTAEIKYKDQLLTKNIIINGD